MELSSTKRTYKNVLEYLRVYDNTITPITDDELRTTMQVNDCVVISVIDKAADKRIVVCISKHSSSVANDNKLIKKLCLKINITPIKQNTDVMFVIYDTDAEAKIDRHKKKIKDYEHKYRAQYTQYNINMRFYSYNRFRFTLDELKYDGIIRYTVVDDEIDLMNKIGIKKGQIPIIFLNDDSMLINMHVEVGQIVREEVFNKNCGRQITYKRVV